MILLLLVFLMISGIHTPAARAQDPAGVLKSYVDRIDDSYGWVVRQRIQLGTCAATELTLTSQTWRGLVWQHRLFLLVPEGVEGDAEALLFIEGGSWDDKDAGPVGDDERAMPTEALLLAAYAQQLGSPVAVLLNVPRQPIFEGRREDEIIALTFDRFLETGDSDWPLLLPMTKSAVRAMDAIQAFGEEQLGLQIDAFTVAGASKRGWTAWLTAAVDPRVKGLVPMVIDMLNMEAQFDHQLASYGTFSELIDDYTDRDLPRRMRGEAGRALRQIVDPYSYREQIDQPKLMLLGTNDGYWTVDSLNLYWKGLRGPKYITYVPNADHDLASNWPRILGSLFALHRDAHGKEALPTLTWTYEGADPGQRPTLKVVPGSDPVEVRLWTAEAPTRDFREARWTGSPLTVDADGSVTCVLEKPAKGYRASYVEVVYSRESFPLYLSTTIRVRGGDQAVGE